MITPKNDLDANVKVVFADNSQDSAAPVLIIAAGTGDGVKTTGETVDRIGYTSGVFALAGEFTLGNTETVSFAVEIQDSPDDSSWNTAVALQAATVEATGSGSGTTEEFTIQLGVDFAAYDRYVRFNVTPDCSAGSADTGLYAALCVLGGADILPAA